MSELKLVCEICGPRAEPIGVFDTEIISVPITGVMFQSIDSTHEVPPPFHAEADWEHCYCPMCRKRAFIEKNKVLTTEGYYVIGSKEIPGQEPEIQKSFANLTPEELEVEWKERLSQKTREMVDNEQEENHISFICSVCNQKFTNKRALNMHQIGKKHRGN